MKHLRRIICFLKGHYFNSGGGGHTDYGDYQFSKCGRCGFIERIEEDNQGVEDDYYDDDEPWESEYIDIGKNEIK